MEDLIKRLNYLIDREAGGKYSVFAKKCGIPHTTFYNYTKGRTPHTEHLCRIQETFNIDLNWLLSGKGEPYLPAVGNGSNGRDKKLNSPEQRADTIETQSIELFQDFSDKQRALNITRELVDLEKLDPEEFKRIETYIQATVDALKSVVKKKIYTGPDRRNFKRRKQNIPGDYSGENDRRSLIGRREEDQREEDQTVNG